MLNFTKDSPSYSTFSIGRGTYGYPDIRWPQSNLIIGSFCSIGANVTIFLGGNHEVESPTTYPLQRYFDTGPNKSTSKGDVVIGNDVWIGEGATILSGVKLGDGCIVGAKAVVANSFEPYSIIIGNPAYRSHYRFPVWTIKRLLKLKWWEWEDEKLLKHVDLLLSPLNEENLRKLEEV